MKTSKLDARKNLVINGDLLDAVLKGATVLEYQFNGWDWYVLVKLAETNNDGFDFIQYETVGNDKIFVLMVQRNGTKRRVLVKFLEDFHETRRIKNIAFELGNIN